MFEDTECAHHISNSIPKHSTKKGNKQCHTKFLADMKASKFQYLTTLSKNNYATYVKWLTHVHLENGHKMVVVVVICMETNFVLSLLVFQ